MTTERNRWLKYYAPDVTFGIPAGFDVTVTSLSHHPRIDHKNDIVCFKIDLIFSLNKHIAKRITSIVILKSIVKLEFESLKLHYQSLFTNFLAPKNDPLVTQ